MVLLCFHVCLIHCYNQVSCLRMANSSGSDSHEWIQRLKTEGTVPLLDPENCPNGWASPPGDKFMVRGPDYFSTKTKIKGGEYLLKPLGFDWIKCSTKTFEVLNNRNSRVRRAIDEEFSTCDTKPFVWAFNLLVPSKDNHSAVAYFISTEPIEDGSLMDQFIKGDDAFRNSRLKLIANIVKGPWIVRKAVGEQAICIIGKAVSCKYFVTEKYIEVDLDIGSSVVANAIVHLAFGYITSLTVDLAFLIESQHEEELPERILGAVRFSELNPDSAQSIGSCDGLSGNRQSSLPTRLWKSIGQGFSHLIHHDARDNGSVSSSTHVNGIAHQEKQS